MGAYWWAQICDDGHIRHVAENQDGLSSDTYCDLCGSQLHDVCPQCNAPIRTIRVESDEGEVKWKKRNNCYHCGADLPWKPSRTQRFINKLASNSGPSPSGPLLTGDLRETLEETKYGHEVVKHIRDGDGCYRNSLWQPALSSYIHAFEWAAIAYLEAVAGLDIIEQERNGNLYYFAKGNQNLLDELEKHVDVDQKTISRIKSMNQAERRWMAHHKSGTTLPDEVNAARARLREFLQTLFA